MRANSGKNIGNAFAEFLSLIDIRLFCLSTYQTLLFYG